MRTRSVVALLVLLATTAIVVIAGCSRQPTTAPSLASHAGLAGAGGPPDTSPPPPPTPPDTVPAPPPPPPLPPPPPPGDIDVACASSDSNGVHGGTVTVHFRVGNLGGTARTLSYTLTSLRHWSGFPVHGTVSIAGGASTILDFTVAIPDSASGGFNRACLEVSTPAGPSTGCCDIYFDGNPSPPPPPPPPPPPIPGYEPVTFVGADSAARGGHAEIRWSIGNNSGSAFTTSWTMSSGWHWPGFPQSGQTTVDAQSRAEVRFTIAIPDTATIGDAPFTMTATQPNGQPSGSVIGRVHVTP